MIFLIVTADRLLWLRRMNKENTQLAGTPVKARTKNNCKDGDGT